MSITVLPIDGQVQFMLDSPMTATEQDHLAQIESSATSSAGKITINKIVMAQCLLEVYNDKLFRGKTGGRTWGEYLKSVDFGKLGFQKEITTDTAAGHLNYAALCDAIDDWNDEHPARSLPYPPGWSHLQGWTLLFERDRDPQTGAGHGYMPITGAESALKAWYTAVVNNGGKVPDKNTCRAYGRKARDAGMGRAALTNTNNSENLTPGRFSPAQGGAKSEPEFTQSTSSAAERMQAAADRAAREQRQADARAEERSLREDGIDPRSVSTMEKESDFNVMNECETYSTQMNKVHFELQTLEVWVRGRLNQYGTDGMNMLRQFDAGIYSITDDIGTITDMATRLADLANLLQDHVEPGSLTNGKFQSEPNA